LTQYDTNTFAPALVQVLHRTTAYLLSICIVAFFWYAKKQVFTRSFTVANIMLITMLIIQFTLGVLTVINCKATIPVGLGVLHQAGALLLLSVALLVNYQFSDTNLKAGRS
jgi:heme a synthase